VYESILISRDLTSDTSTPAALLHGMSTLSSPPHPNVPVSDYFEFGHAGDREIFLATGSAQTSEWGIGAAAIA
jgi:hypothetical protein